MERNDIRVSLLQEFERNRERYVREWTELLRFPSVSTLDEHHQDCLDCARWLADHLGRIGFEAQLLETRFKPVVYAERPGERGRPIVLFYGHYDVQPADPLDQWTHPPFDPVLRGGRLYARGAEDNKGQLFYALKAMETLIRRGSLRSTVKILLEGEEESGSRGLAEALPEWRERVRSDVLMVSDTHGVESGAPTIIMGLRGIVQLTAALSGPLHDLHSGVHGGVAPNPALEMARLLASLHRADGRIAVKGFYDSVAPPTGEERELANAHAPDDAAYQAMTGVPPAAGEKEFTPAERTAFRPSLDINGIHSGFGGKGSKTIIPAKAFAKITARLVAGQDPERCLQAVITHLAGHAPSGLRFEVEEQGVGGPALRMDLRSPWVARAKKVLETLSGRDTAFLWEGASIPIVSALSRVSGAEPLLVGFGREADRIHAPDESFSLEQFRSGYLYVAHMLESL